jgi:ATP-dependent Clp endopeptidase proteolytic subunit ClpP
MPEFSLPPALAKAKVREANAAAAKLEAEAAMAEIELEATRRVEQDLLASNLYHHVYVFDGTVGAQTVQHCIKTLTLWHRTSPGCDIEIVFNSPGGSVTDGLALFDYIQTIRRQGHHVTTVALGIAASMAGILLMAGDTRAIGAESWLMIHEAAFGTSGKTGEVEDMVDWVKKVQERILDIFAARSTHTKAQIKNRWRRKDWWLSSTEALDWGFVDEVR